MTDFFYRSFCGQNEDNDPSEEFEEYLTCTVCGDHCMLVCGTLHFRWAIFTDLI